MKTVCIVQARMTSTRLPGKVLLPLGGKTVLACVIDRLQHAKNLDQIVVATTTDREDDAIVNECVQRGYEWFRGDREDVLDRYYQCAKDYQADVIVRVTSDCPLIDASLVDEIVSCVNTKGNLYAHVVADGVHHRSFPRGLNAEAFGFPILEQLQKTEQSTSSREHVTFGIYSYDFNIKKIYADENLARPKWRLTLDTHDDYHLLKLLFEEYQFHEHLSLQELIYKLDQNLHLQCINSHVVQKQV